MLTTLLPWAALALAVLALLLRDGTREEGGAESRGWMARVRANSGPLWAVFAVLLAALAVGWFWRDSLKDLWPVALGFAWSGVLVSTVCKLSYLKGQPANAFSAPFAWGVFGSAIWTLIPMEDRAPYQLGAAAGAGLCAWILGSGERSVWPVRASVVAIACLSGDLLGHLGAKWHSAQAGSLLGLLAAFALLLAFGLPGRRALGLVVGGIALGVGSWLLATRHFFLNDLWLIFGGSALVGLVLAWLMPDEGAGEGSLNFVLSVIVWLAVATLAFGLRRGYGMSVALVGGIAGLSLAGRTRALLALGPLAMLVAYRVFRELNPDASRALDIGQHYALIGLAAGIALPVLASEWRAKSRSHWAAALWVPVFLAVPFVSGVVLSAKGFVGVLAGIGFGSFIEGLKGSGKPDILALQGGLAMAMVSGFAWMADKTDLARDEKIAALAWVAGGLVVVFIVIGLLSRSGKESAGSTS